MFYSGNCFYHTPKKSLTVVARNVTYMVCFDLFVRQLETKIFFRIKPNQKDVCGLGFFSLGLFF